MKKILKLAAVAASVIAVFSCQKEVEQVTEPQAIKSFTFNVAHEGVDTKSSLNANATAFQWDGGETVGVYVGSNTNLECQVTKDATATITVTPTVAVGIGDKVLGYFPYSAESASSSAAKVIIPSEQNGETIANAMPMYSVPIVIDEAIAGGNDTEPTMYFNNLAGVLQFNVYSTEAEYRSEVVKSVKFQKEGVSGTFLINLTGTPELVGGDSNIITSTVPTPKAVGTDKATPSNLVYMVVAPNTYNGAVVTVTTDKATYTATLTSDLKVAKNQVIPFNINLANANVDRYEIVLDEYDFKTAGINKTSGPNAGNMTTASNDVVLTSKTGNTTDAWTIKFTGNTYYSYCANNGLQFGTSSKEVHADLTSKEYTKVLNVCVVTTTTNANVDLSVSVGDVEYGSKTITTGSSINHNFEHEAASGIVKVTLNSTTTQNVKVEKIIISYIDVPISVDGISLDKTTADLPVGQNLTLTATIIPDNATNKSVTWTSSDANVATVDEDGVVTAVAVGNATITATTVDGGFTATCVVNVTNAFTSIQSIFDAATATETEVTVKFNNWIVSGVNGSNAYVTDNDGKGFIINQDTHEFNVGDILSGTVSCQLKTYYGAAALVGVSSTSDGISVTSGGIIVAKEIAIADLSGVNTGALLHFSSLVYNGTTLSDGTNTIKPYTTFMSPLPTLVNNRSYEVTGIYVPYYTTKQIAPRSESDIVAKPYFTATANTTSVAAAGGTVTITVDTNVDGWTASSSDNTNFAVSTEGNTVTVTVAENTGEERTGTISFTVAGLSPEPIIIIQANPSAGGGETITWTRCTTVAEIQAGGTFIIGYEATANSGIIIPMANSGSASTSAAGFMYSGASAASGKSDTINMSSVETTTNYEVTIIASADGNVAIKVGENYLGNANTKNNCKLFTADNSENGTSLTVTVGTNDVFTFKNANTTYHTLQYNTTSPRFAFYKASQKNLVVYKKTIN